VQDKKTIVVAGGGTAGWLAAAALGKLFGRVYNVCLIESDEIGRIGVGEATIPPLRTFHRLLGVDELELIKAMQGTYKLGIEFINWARKSDSYFHSFGITGKDCWACDFQHFWVGGRQRGLTKDPFGVYSPELMAALAGKMWAYQEHGLNFAYHLDAGLYANYMRKHALANGVRRVEGVFDRVNIDPSTGNITSLVMRNGDEVRGDFFLDCTGFAAALIAGALKVPYHSYEQYLPCDSAVALQTEKSGEPRSYTQAIAHDFGWQWRIPLQHRAGNGLVYCSRYVSDDEAMNTLLANLEGKPITEPRAFKYKTGRRIKAWEKNCIAVGLAAGFLEPLESTSIHLGMSAVLRFMKLLSHGEIKQTVVDEYNKQFCEEMDRVRNFIILHYCATERDDSPFWRYCKSMEIPSALRHRIELFRETGAVPLQEKELFQVDSWTQVMIGQRIVPATYHPIVDQMGDAELKRFLEGLKENVAAKVVRMPSHQEFIDRYCKAPAM
jgi:tryptophan 7-halogenase